MKEEQWKKIPGHPNYEVSNLGRVRSIDRDIKTKNQYGQCIKKRKGKVLAGALDHSGYYNVGLCDGRKKHTKKIHQLVAMAFLGHQPSGSKMVIDHINEDKLDNRLENLRIVTVRENSIGPKKRTESTSKFKGVHLHKPTGKWLSKIQINGERIHLGLFEDEMDAYLAYQEKVMELDY